VSAVERNVGLNAVLAPAGHGVEIIQVNIQFNSCHLDNMPWRHQLSVEASAAAVRANVDSLVIGEIDYGAALWKSHQLPRGGEDVYFLIKEILFDRV
jgi:hypothetical protein